MSDLMVIDTDVLIDVGRGVGEAILCLDRVLDESNAAISAVSEMELIVGCRNKTELRSLNLFVRRFKVIELDVYVTATATRLLKKYRLSHGLLIPDALIAATAMANGAGLVSKNQRDYRFIKGLALLPYPSPFQS